MKYKTFLASVLCSIVLFGCGGGGNTPVSGKVKRAGAAFTKKGTVTFYPNKTKGNESTSLPTGELNEQGEFKLMTAGKEGAPLGWYKVTINSQSPSNPKDPYSVPLFNVDKKYTSVETSDLAIEVKSNAGPEDYTINLP